MKIRITSIFFLLFLQYNCHIVYAQKHQIQFHVKDEHKQAVADLLCTLANDSMNVIAFSLTDSVGHARLEAPQGTYTLNISLFSKSLYNSPVVITKPLNLGEIIIESPSLAMDGVTVTAQRRSFKEKDGKLIFDVRSIPIQQNANALDALAYTPMISLSSTGVSIAGQSGEIRINGVKQDKSLSLYDYLSSIQLSQIVRIEVHSGRTADMDATLSGGYVNIILRDPSGLKGHARGSFSYNGNGHNNERSPLFSENLSSGITYGKGKFSLFTNASFGNRNLRDLEEKNHYLIKSQDYKRVSQGHTIEDRLQSLNFTYGSGYTLDKHKFNIEGTFFSNLNSNSKATQSLETQFMNMTEYQNIWKINTPDILSYSFFGGYQFLSKNEKNKINWIANYVNNTNDFQVNYHIKDHSLESRNEVIRNNSSSNMLYTQLSFNQKANNSFNWSAGVKYSTTNRKNTNFFAADNQPASTDHYNYKETIPSAFINGQLSLKKIYLSMGLRMEHTRLKSDDASIKESYSDLFPSITASYVLARNKSIRLDYSRSIFRPPFALLNNYSIKTSELEYSVGNPLLKAQKTDIVGINFIANKHVIRASWAYTPNPIAEKIYSIQDTLYTTNVNDNRQYAFNLSYSFNGNVMSFWYLSFNLGLQYLSLPQSEYKKNITQGYASMLNTFNLTKSLKFQLDGKYASPWIMNDRKVEDRFNIDMTLRYAVSKHDLVFTLLCKNIVARRRTAAITDNKYVYYNSWSETAPFSIEAGVSWSFSIGKKKNIQYKGVPDNNLDKYRL